MLLKLTIRLVPLFLCAIAPLSAALAEPLPVEDYAALPQIDGPRLSPDGKAVAMISPRDGRAGVRVWRATGEVEWFMPMGEDRVNWIAWKGSDRILMSLHATDWDGGFERPVGVSRLVFADLQSKEMTPVKFHEPVQPDHVIVVGRTAYRPPNVQDRVISMLPDDPGHILLAAASDDWAHADAMMVDVAQGSPSRLMRSTGNVVKWLADSKGTIRLKASVERHEEASTLIFSVRDSAQGDWRVLQRYEVDHGPRLIPLAFSRHAPDDLLALVDQENGRLALQQIDTRTGAMGPVLASDAQCDIEPVLRDSQVSGYTDSCRGEEETYFDEGWQKDQAVLRHALKTQFVEIIDRTPDGRYALLKSMATANAPPVYWYFDQANEHAKTLVRIADSFEHLKPEMVAPTRTVSIPARDGLVLPALLTLPVGAENGPIPFVVLPHGGPTAHDSVQYDWIVQFIASRGYGVLQPQFRGSTGYGAAFQRAGYRQWGGSMQDDVTDATRWLLQQKLADPKRMCIVGSSYGGYAALMGAAQHPELYQCAAAIAPVTDMERLMKDRDHTEFGDVNHSRVVGNMESVGVPSPVDRASRITVPVLLIHGRRDFTVPVGHTEAMEAALRATGHPAQVIYLRKTDHFFNDEDGRLQTLKALDAFLSSALSGVRTSRS